MSSLMNKKIKSKPVYDQSLINKNYRNFRTSDDVEIKPVAKRDQRNKTTTTKFHNEVRSAYCDVIVVFSIYGRFGVIQKPDFERIVWKTHI